MQNFMVTVQLPNEFSEEFVKLIPKQRMQVNKLMDEGKIVQYTVSEDRSTAWIVLVASDEQAALDILATLPLVDFYIPTIHPLLFHNSVSNELPKLIMN